MSVSLFLVSTHWIWFWNQIDSGILPIKRDSVGSGHMSCCRVGLLPLMTILITVSLLSTFYNSSTFRFTFLLGLVLEFRKRFPAVSWVGDSVFFEECNTSINGWDGQCCL